MHPNKENIHPKGLSPIHQLSPSSHFRWNSSKIYFTLNQLNFMMTTVWMSALRYLERKKSEEVEEYKS
jgi:hypothetical protein